MPARAPWNQKLGMVTRLSRIFRDDGRALIIAADHRQRGIQGGLENFKSLTERMYVALGHADAIVTTKEPMATLISSHPESGRKGLLLSLNRAGLGGSVFEVDDRPVNSPAMASRWGLDGTKFLLRIDPANPHTASQLETCGKLCEECDSLELPMIIEPLFCRESEGKLTVDTSPERVRYAAIIANDYSVPAIKIPYPKGSTRSKRRRDFRDIVASVSSRVLILGGSRTRIDQVLAQAEDSVREGGSGVVIGRNILLHERPEMVTSALNMIIHDDFDAETALRKAREDVKD